MPRSADQRRVQRMQLMERSQDGDRDAYRELLEDVSRMLARFIGRRVVDPNEAEDILQDTLVALHRARHTYQPSRPLEPWLFAIARNVVAGHNRRQLGRMTWEVLVDAVPEPAGVDAPPQEEQLTDALRRLPTRQREAFEMLKLEGLTIEAAAARAGISQGALKLRAHRAYKAIKGFLGG